jgi:hypothetical protein
MSGSVKARKLMLTDVAAIVGARETRVYDPRTANSLEAIAEAFKSKKPNEQVYLVFLIR